MAIVLNGQTNDVTINGVSVATDTEVTNAVTTGTSGKANTSHTHTAANVTDLGTTITAAITAQRASSTVYGVAKISVSGSILTITTT